MKRRENGSFYIQVDRRDKTTSYTYLMDVVLSPEEAEMALPVEGGAQYEKIEISKAAYNLAVLRTFPQTESEVQEIINYSKGKPTKISIFEKIILWLKM